jgi:hypothetical protein
MCSMYNWNLRRYCSIQCGAKGRKHLPHTIAPGRQEKLCECGLKATKTIHFNILPIEHRALVETSMRVCDDCYQYMLENDRGSW